MKYNERNDSRLSEERRRFLKAMGLFGFTLGTASLAGDGVNLAEAQTPPLMQGKVDFDETVFTTCDICMVRCAMKVYKKDGKAVFLEGNPADPFNKGHLCPKGKAALGFMNNPDRLLYPMKRTNPKKGFDEDPGIDKYPGPYLFCRASFPLTPLFSQNKFPLIHIPRRLYRLR